MFLQSSSRVQLMGALNSKEDEVLALKARLTMADTKIAELRAHGKTVAQAAATVKASQRTLSEQCRRLAKSLSEATLRSRHTAARHAAAIRDTEVQSERLKFAAKILSDTPLSPTPALLSWQSLTLPQQPLK